MENLFLWNPLRCLNELQAYSVTELLVELENYSLVLENNGNTSQERRDSILTWRLLLVGRK